MRYPLPRPLDAYASYCFQPLQIFFSVCRRLLLRCGERLWRCSGLDTLKDSSMFHNNGSVVDVPVVFQRQVFMILRMLESQVQKASQTVEVPSGAVQRRLYRSRRCRWKRSSKRSSLQCALTCALRLAWSRPHVCSHWRKNALENWTFALQRGRRVKR